MPGACAAFLLNVREADLGVQHRDITFASVHDSYWTHACSVDEMSEIIRETFIALHSSDVLGKLAEEVSPFCLPVPATR